MENVVRAVCRPATGVEIPDISFHHPELRRPLDWTAKDVVEVRVMPGREVVDADNGLTEREKLLQQVGSDETGNASDYPDFRGGHKLLSKATIRCGDHELAVEEYPPGRFQSRVRGSTSARSYAPQLAAFVGERQSIFHSR